MKRVWPIVATIAALTAACLATATAHAAAPQSPRTASNRVTIVLAPYLTWDDLSPSSTPAIWRLAENGSLAGINARSRVRESGQSAAPLEAALAISAGSWALPEWSAPAAFTATETYAGGTAADAYLRTFGEAMGSARIAYLGKPMTERSNRSASVDIVLGTLGQSVRDAGGLVAAIGNSDIGFSETDARPQRPAAVAAIDASGLVPYGDVSTDLLKASASAPYGRATDMERFASEYDQVSAFAAAHKGPSLVVLDSGDLSRARDFAPQVADAVASQQRAEALGTLDGVVELADERRGADGIVIVASQALFADADGAPQGVGPLVISGPGFESGFATSSSTHRRGLVTNLDITATALEALGLRRPVQVLGNPMVAQAGPASVAERVELLTRTNAAFVAIEGLRMPIAAVLLVLAVAVLALTVVVALLAPRLTPRALRRWTTMLRAGLLLALAIPVASWLAFAFVPTPSSQAIVLSAFAATALVIAAVFFSASGVSSRVPVAALSLFTATVLIAEQFFRAPLSIMSLLGYSPLMGGRYYGMGNEGAAITFGAVLVGVALLLDQWPTASFGPRGRHWGVAVLGAIFVAVAAAPFLGANVGVAVWGTVGFSFAWLLLNGRAVTGWRLLAIAAMVVLVVATLSAIDLLGGGEQTHLARALADAERGGLGTLWAIVARKAGANAHILSNTGLSWMLAAVAGLALFARWRPGSDWPALMAENPAFASVAFAASVAGVAAFFSEDSGIVIPALIALYVGVALAWLMVMRLTTATGGGEPE